MLKNFGIHPQEDICRSDLIRQGRRDEYQMEQVGTTVSIGSSNSNSKEKN